MEFVVIQQASEKIPCVGKPLGVVSIHDEDETLGVRIIMSNQRPHVRIVPRIPHGELYLPILYLFDVEANGRHCIEDTGQLGSKLESVQDRSLASRVQPGKEYPRLLDTLVAFPHTLCEVTHFYKL